MYVVIMSLCLQKVKIFFFSASFFYLEDRDVCDHYDSIASESQTDRKFKL